MQEFTLRPNVLVCYRPAGFVTLVIADRGDPVALASYVCGAHYKRNLVKVRYPVIYAFSDCLGLPLICL